VPRARRLPARSAAPHAGYRAGRPRDVFSNGINLNVIEAADDPAAESWRNINAINDLVEAILTTTSQLTVAALAGNAAAGGLMLALAADEVWCRAGAVLNPHYQLMGLHGSEYWTYTLPRRVGAEQAARLTGECLPVSPVSGLRCGLVDQVFVGGAATYRGQVATLAGNWPAARLPTAAGREGTAADRGRHHAAA
jgi:putative two-component system hydrogenase maturation factor HypX/HoxX